MKIRRNVVAGALAATLGLAIPAAASAGALPSPEAAAAEPTQVSAVPAGGAAAGGGERSAGGTDAGLLIGVGIAAVAGSIGLFAAAQVAGRRD